MARSCPLAQAGRPPLTASRKHALSRGPNAGSSPAAAAAGAAAAAAGASGVHPVGQFVEQELEPEMGADRRQDMGYSTDSEAAWEDEDDSPGDRFVRVPGRRGGENGATTGTEAEAEEEPASVDGDWSE